MDLARVAVGFAVILVMLLAVLLVLWSTQRGLLYFPDDRVVPPASGVIPNAEDVVFSTEEGLRLRGWFVPAREARAAVLVLNCGLERAPPR